MQSEKKKRARIEHIHDEIIEVTGNEEIDTGKMCYQNEEGFSLGISEDSELEELLNYLTGLKKEMKAGDAISIKHFAPGIVFIDSLVYRIKHLKPTIIEWYTLSLILSCCPVTSEDECFIDPLEKAIISKWTNVCVDLLWNMANVIIAEGELKQTQFKKRELETVVMKEGFHAFYAFYRQNQGFQGVVNKKTKSDAERIIKDEGILRIFLEEENAREYLFRYFGNSLGYTDQVVMQAFDIKEF